MLALSNQASDFWIPQNFDLSEALGQTTHLAIGAHQDDLEFMAYEGIFACYHSDENGLPESRLPTAVAALV